MMDATATLGIVVKAKDEASQALGKIEGQANKTNSAFGKLAKAAVAAAVVLVTALVGAGVAAADLATKYQASTNQLAASANITIAAANKVTAVFLTQAGKTTFSAQTTVDAYKGVAAQLGLVQGKALTGAQALAFMTQAQNLAEASGSSLASVTSSLAKVLQAFQLPTSAAASVTDILFNSARLTGQSIEALTMSLTRVRSQMGTAAPPLKELGGLMVDLAQHGETGRAALATLSSAFTGIISPSKAVIAAQKAMHVSFLDTRTKALLPLAQIFAELAPKLDKMSATQAAATLKTLGFGAASNKLAATIQAGPAELQKYINSVDATGSAHAAADKASSGFSATMEKLRSAVTDAGIALGQKLLPVFTIVANWLMTQLPTAVKIFGGLLDWLTTTVFPQVNNTVNTVSGFFNTVLLPAFRDFAKYVQGTVVPALQSLVSWFMHNVYPTLTQVASFIFTQVVPKLALISSTIISQVLPQLLKFGQWAWTNVIDPLTQLAMKVIPPLLSALQVLASHLGAFMPLLIPIVGLIAGMWAVNKITAWGSTALSVIKAVTAKTVALITLQEVSGTGGGGGGGGGTGGGGGGTGGGNPVNNAINNTGVPGLSGIQSGAIVTLVAGAVLAGIQTYNTYKTLGTDNQVSMPNAGGLGQTTYTASHTGDAIQNLSKLGKLPSGAGDITQLLGTIVTGGPQGLGQWLANAKGATQGGGINDAMKEFQKWKIPASQINGLLGTLAQVTKTDGDLSAYQMQLFLENWTNGVQSSKVLAATVNGQVDPMQTAMGAITDATKSGAISAAQAWQAQEFITAAIQTSGPLTAAQAAAMAINVANGATSAFDLNLSFETAVHNLSTLPQNSADLAAQVAAAKGKLGAIRGSTDYQTNNITPGAEGLIVRGATHALLGEGRGGETEWAIPAHKAQGMGSVLTALVMGRPVRRFAEGGIINPGGGGFGGERDINITVELDGRVLARSVVKHTGKMNKLSGYTLGSNS